MIKIKALMLLPILTQGIEGAAKLSNKVSAGEGFLYSIIENWQKTLEQMPFPIAMMAVGLSIALVYIQVYAIFDVCCSCLDKKSTSSIP